MNKRFSLLLLLVLMAATGGGCTGRLLPQKEASTPLRGRYTVIVTATADDSLASLARTYLKDERRAWQIAAYNNINTVTAGQKVVIPLKPVIPGGLQASGYQTIPVLLYDHLDAGTSQKRGPSAADFERQLQYLKNKGFTTLGLDEFHDFTALKAWLPPLSVLICLDSTERWVYDLAYPLLNRYGMQATVFVAVKAVGGKGRMTWEELSQMARAGISIGTCGMTGDNLTRAKSGEAPEDYLDRIETEIRDARRIMEKRLNRPCPDFAYPDGAFNDYLIALLKKYGYRSGYTRKSGSNPFFVDDYKIRRTLAAASWNAKALQKHLTTFRHLELR